MNFRAHNIIPETKTVISITYFEFQVAQISGKEGFNLSDETRRALR
jgi:hypothetical protein